MSQPKVDKNKLTFQGAISVELLEEVLGIFSLSEHVEAVVETAKLKNETPAATSGGNVFQRIQDLLWKSYWFC